ncbi:MAG: hypothetical protein ACR2GO_08915 [Candidatus Limnocylindria bacterium]
MQIPPALIEAMPINDKDRHVLALAVHVGATTIVTDNVRDFPTDLIEPFGVEAISSDAFALAQVDLHPAEVLASVEEMAARRRHSPRTKVEIIESLARFLPQAMDALRRHQ